MKTRTFIPVLATGIFLSASMLLSCPASAVAQESTGSPAAAPSSAGKTADTEFGDGVVVELQSVTRGENDITVKFKYTNNGSKPVEFHHSNYGHANIAAEVYYIDPKNKKKYTPLKDSEGKPVASLAENIRLGAAESKTAWVKLPAPPADTATVTIVLPGAPPFEKVTVASQ